VFGRKKERKNMMIERDLAALFKMIIHIMTVIEVYATEF